MSTLLELNRLPEDGSEGPSTVRVEHAGAAPSDKHVPEVEGLVLKRVEANRLGRLNRLRSFEQQQLDFRGRLRKEGEVHAVW